MKNRTGVALAGAVQANSTLAGPRLDTLLPSAGTTSSAGTSASSSLERFDAHFDAGALQVLSVDQVVHVKDSVGGTAPRRVREQISQLRKLLRP